MRSCSWLVALCFAAPAVAAEPPQVQGALDRFVQSTETLEASFLQEVVDASGDITSSSEGVFRLRRPDQFRWIYRQPYEQEIIGDGQTVWVFDKDLEQVTKNAQQEAMNPASRALLAGRVDALREEFSVQETPLPKLGETIVSLETIKDQGNFSKVRFTFAGDQLRRIELDDGFGSTTRIIFASYHENVPLTDADFAFTPPSGVDVVEGQF